MANQEHLAILKQGVEVWNQWRIEHPEIQPDLSYTPERVYNEAQLEGVKLLNANLKGANLRDVHLEGTHLRGVHLEGANLRYAHLERTFLMGVHLEGANLWGAHLEGAYLIEAHLEGANLKHAIFDDATRLDDIILCNEKQQSAILVDVIWSNANLSVVNWAPMKILGDEYEACQKQRIEVKKTKQERETEKKEKLTKYVSAVRAYRQLAAVLRDQGLNEEADYFAYRAQMLQRVVLRRQRKPLKYLFSWFLYLLAGYGYRPIRSVVIYLLLILGFALTYYGFGHLPPFPDSLVFSLTSFHGRGFFPGLGNETSLHNPLVVLAALEAVIGLFVEISFIATFTKRFFSS